MPTVNILSHDNGVGLSKDYKLLSGAISSPCKFVDLRGSREAGKADINVFIELIKPSLFSLARINYFIPNPEWFKQDWIPQLRHFDKILCKTHDTERIFRKMGYDTQYIGFTSEDKWVPSIKKEYKFFHGAGKSSMKGTKYVLDVFDNTKNIPPVTYFEAKDKFLSDDDFTKEQNRHLFHVCPSEYEGYGHYIHEAKSMGAIVITTDAAPMNEFITKDNGILCRPVAQKNQGLATLKICNAKSIQQGVFQALQLAASEIKEMSEKSRQSWEEGDRFFRNKIKEIL